MQKSLLILLFFGIVLCGKVVGKLKIVCNEKNKVKTCRADDILMSVETKVSNAELSEPTVSVILAGAFEECAELTVLRLNLRKGPIILSKNPFKGLSWLSEIYFGDSLVTLYDDTFQSKLNLKIIKMRLCEFTTELANKFDNLHYLKELRIKNGHLENIKAHTFNSNKNYMEILELSPCSIFSIEANAFAALIHLVTLDLSNNTLMRITPDTFKGLSKLKTLNLTNNNLYTIGVTAFNGLIELVTFDISYNDLIEIASTAFHNLKIGDFMLNKNRFKKIAKGLFNYPNSNMSQNIYLQNNFIDKIEDGAFALSKKEILNIYKNPLVLTNRKVLQELKKL
ncbi:insulin-like growth factor-binding protein complex acid labile subunit isoform X1 [Aphidius gifuensis]|uniref:insulin-like growth factor-binding protein complex acid labile subunit isoform X1 n=1 Tax=Aphidius gifuensis TaxID=684658 RepID=UPI001CDC9F55|nr:insulin-like growth factor-binding protein complex acid labile subunit isoform X1 [Aphidius gifuensis]XP_044002783.1 insulin-like growth factor-binding protein complex acid labile subunit isoform X1 [Aphidius gifuensis]